MAKLFQTLFRGNGRKPSTEVSRYNLDWYIQQLNNPYALYSAGGTTYRDGRSVEETAHNFAGYVQSGYRANGPIFAIVLARMLLFTEARLAYRRLINGRPGDLFGAENGELDLLQRPWPNGTTGELLARMEQDVSFGGNSYTVNEGDRLRRLRPDWVSIVLSGDPEQEFEVDVLGYAYTPGGLGRGETKVYLPDEVCHWSPIPDPLSQYRGMSWLTSVIRELQADQAATDHKSAFFRNGASPRLVVSLKESVREEQFKKFVRAMSESTGSTDQAYKTMYLAGGADVTVAGADLRQLDFRATQGAGETRLCAAGGVPPIIVGLSEGLQAATYSNYSSARRKFGDHWARPQWRSACAALSNITEVPDGAELWYDDRDIAFLREDQKDAAEIASMRASTINVYITAGFTPESSVSAVDADDVTLLVHSGMVSVQLQPPGAGVPEGDPALAGETPPAGEIEAARAGWNPAHHPRDARGRFRKLGGGDLALAGGSADTKDLSGPKLYALFADLLDEDPPNERALRLVGNELEVREDAARRRAEARRNRVPSDLSEVSDDRLYELWSAHAADDQAVARVKAEISARRRSGQRDGSTPLVDWSEHRTDRLEQRRIDKAVASGVDLRDAYADAYRLDDDLVRDQRYSLVDLERRAGESRRDAVRRAFAEHTTLRYIAAEQSTRGNLLTAEAVRAGVDPIALFSGPSARARKWASEDLKRWWADNPRVTYTEFAGQVLTGDRRTNLQGNGRDFGV